MANGKASIDGVTRGLPPMESVDKPKYIMSDFERGVCSQFDVRYISRNRIDDRGDYVDFWSGKPRRICYGNGWCAYYCGPGCELIMQFCAERIDTHIQPGECLRVYANGRCEYVTIGGSNNGQR